ncbi:hypothetical protein [Mongoliimonas terrestris]|uniref:hypothetical protein n=1 Tax=Mongoliimonas terrestris TaxID=1709001 RepID=UPI0015881EFF|nr:hypothetical protein [Mongoliimonas terrestris]
MGDDFVPARGDELGGLQGARRQARKGLDLFHGLADALDGLLDLVVLKLCVIVHVAADGGRDMTGRFVDGDGEAGEIGISGPDRDPGEGSDGIGHAQGDVVQERLAGFVRRDGCCGGIESLSSGRYRFREHRRSVEPGGDGFQTRHIANRDGSGVFRTEGREGDGGAADGGNLHAERAGEVLAFGRLLDDGIGGLEFSRRKPPCAGENGGQPGENGKSGDDADLQ